MKNLLALLPCLFLLAALSGCPSKSSAPAPTASATPSAAAAPSASNATNDNVQVGKPPPDFTALTYDDETVTLSKLKGRPVVIYFYPKDETPGCTKEACSFRDAWKDLAATNAVLIGISADSAASHKKFVEHWKLPFILISDEDTGLAQKFGVPMEIEGNDLYESRQTFVIGADGNVKKIYREVDVTQHAAQVLADLKT
jgi:peroxiredoxin Q/BCP